MQVVNTNFISGKTLSTIGIVQGSTVHSKNIGKDLTGMIGAVAAVDERHSAVSTEKLDRLVSDKPCHDDVNISAYIFYLGDRLTENEV